MNVLVDAPRQVASILPGVIACAFAAGIALGINALAPAFPTMLLAIVLGIVAGNSSLLHHNAQPGLDFAAKHLLRAGIILLGLKVVLADILALGLPIVLTVIAVVVIGVSSTIIIGKALGIHQDLILLMACGFSICGAAAIAGAQTVVKASKAHTAMALTLVVVFGTISIPLLPALGEVLGLSEAAIGTWAGASIHEVAQVVAAAGVLDDPAAMKFAVITKLARVLLLAAVIIAMAWFLRRGSSSPHQQPGQVVPTFVLGFVLMSVLASTDFYAGVIPDIVYTLAAAAQTLLLSMAMFALGCGVKFRDLSHIGWRPIMVATLSTTIVMAIGLAGVLFHFSPR